MIIVIVHDNHLEVVIFIFNNIRFNDKLSKRVLKKI